MQEIYTYRLEVGGQIEQEELNKTSPLEVTVERAEKTTTLFSIHTDQSGLVGLIRHLHGQGYVLLTVSRNR